MDFVWPGHFVRGGGGGIGVESVCWGSLVVCTRVCCVTVFIFCYVTRVVFAVYIALCPF